MKKLTMVAAMLALVLAMAVPAVAAQRDGFGFGNGNGNGLGFGNGLLNGFGLFGNHNGNRFNDGFHDGFNDGFNDGFGGSGVTQAPTQTFVSGSNQNTGGAVNSSGDNSNTCAAQQNFNNSGGVLNQQSLQQYASKLGTGSVFGGASFTNNPQQSVPCEQTVQQSASSSSGT